MNLTVPKLVVVCISLILPLRAGGADLLEVPEVPRDKVICFALYTVHNNILKMTARLYAWPSEWSSEVLSISFQLGSSQ
ncbi:MAG: hypothetical protein ACYS9T_05210 [Planctomycetota bacterium]